MEQDPALSLCRRLLARWTFALARAVEMAVDGGAGDVEEVRDLLDGPIASVVELLREDGSGRGARRRGSRGEGPIDRGDRVA